MAGTYLNFPFALAPEGRFAVADADRHVRQRLEQILFTSPGERVMLPGFGCGVRDLVFEGNSEVLAAATEFTVAKAVQTHMGREVMINAVEVVSEEEKLYIRIVYTHTKDLQQEKTLFHLLPFERGAEGG